MFKIKWLSVLFVPVVASCSQIVSEEENTVLVENPLGGVGSKQIVEFTLPEKYKGWGLKDADSEWTRNQYGESVLLGAVSLLPGTSKYFELVPHSNESSTDSIDLAHAELSVRTGGKWEGQVYVAENYEFEEVDTFTSPPQLTDHSYFLRYEGPGWESDQMGYRLYFDWRNAIDVFVKKDDRVALSYVGQDGYDSYHELSDWGGDALKVGKSLGVGALGRVVGDHVLHFQHVENTQYQLVANSRYHAAFRVNYSGWANDEKGSNSVDVSTYYRIDAYDPTTHIHVELSQPIDNLVAGLVAHENMALINEIEGDWGVVATWGEQSVLGEGDKLGLALFYKTAEAESLLRGDFDHLVVFKPSRTIDYKILAIWPERHKKIDSAESFRAYLKEKLFAINNPPSIRIQ